MKFQYQVRDPLGKMHEGNLEADSEEDARQLLRREGFAVVEISEDRAGNFDLFAKPIKKNDIIYMTTQLAIMVDTGITISTALDAIVEQEENPTLRKLLNTIKGEVESGECLSAALAKHPKYFDVTYVSLVRASEATGTLAEMLETIATYLRKELETKGQVRSAMAYPAVMASIAVSVTIFLLTFILPKFEPLFAKKAASLPKMTKFMMVISDALLGYWWAWIIGLVALAVGFIYGRRTEPGRKVIDWIKIHAPIVGPMFRKVALSRSIRTLGTMVQSGVSMLDALQLSADVAGNLYYKRIWLNVLDQVTSGNRICDSLSKEPLVPSMLVQMISSGENTGKLDEVLERVSIHYDREVEQALKTATSLIEPLMITVMGVVVGAIAMGLLLPIFSLSKPG